MSKLLWGVLLLALLALTQALPVRKTYMTEEPHRNWGHTAAFGPQEFFQPETEEEIIAKVQEVNARGGKLKVVGAGHSWMPIANTPDVLMNLDKYNRTLHIDDEELLVTVQAGIRLWDLNEQLWDAGYALSNLGWSARFTLAGVVGSGTHGTGRKDGILASQVVAFRLVLANGTVITASGHENCDIFNCRTSMGTIGVFSTFTIRVVRRFNMWMDHVRQNITEFFAHMPSDPECMDNIEFWSVYEEGLPAPGYWVEYIRIPTTDPITTGCESETGYDGSNCIDRSYHTFNEEEDSLYAEMEMFIPADTVTAVITEYQDWQREQGEQWVTTAGMERLKGTWTGLRWVKGDNQWLSPAYHRDSVVVSFGLYYRSYDSQDEVDKDLIFFELYARKLQEIAKKVGGRPHWGKMHYFTHDELRQVYPKWDDFMELRESLDPNGMFVNPLQEWLFTPLDVCKKGGRKHNNQEGEDRETPRNEMNFIFSGMIPASAKHH